MATYSSYIAYSICLHVINYNNILVFYCRMDTIIVWLCLITLSQTVNSIEITVDSNNGSSSRDCCEFGNCICNSFYDALSNIQTNGMINIVSPNVSLIAGVNVRNLNNIIITSNNGTTVMCNNAGFLYFNACGNVTVK